MHRGVRAIVSHRLPNAEELEAGCGDWLECCQAYIHRKDCRIPPAAVEGEGSTATIAWRIVANYYPDDDELADAIKAALDNERRLLTVKSNPLLSSEVAEKIAKHIKGKNSDYFSTKDGLAELESITSRHFAAAATPLPETPPNHALVQLLNSALLHPETAEGNIRQVIETLSAAPVVEGEALRTMASSIFADYEPGSKAYSFGLRVVEYLRHENETNR